MLDLGRTTPYSSIERAISAAASNIEPGSALIQAIENGIETVALSGGNSGELFIGVAAPSEAYRPTTHTLVESWTPNSANRTYTLSKTPVGGATGIGITLAGVAGTIDGSAASDNKPQYTAGVVTTHSADDGVLIQVTYRWTMTVLEAQMFFGDAVPGSSAADVTKTLGVVTEGEVYTSCFDTTVAWGGTNVVIKTGANGRFTIGGSGSAIPSGRVTFVPTAERPYLGFWFAN